MPFIHIKSLPLGKSGYLPNIIRGISRDCSEKLGVELDHVHTTWEFYEPKHYAKGDRIASIQPKQKFPLVVDLLTPDSNSPETIKLMLETIAESIAKRAEYPKANIFISHRPARSGAVFDAGKIVHW